MVDGARETYRGTLRVTMFDKGREVVSATTRHACLETGGEFDAEWVSASAMTEPLKSVAYNVDLERGYILAAGRGAAARGYRRAWFVRSSMANKRRPKALLREVSEVRSSKTR